MKAFIHSLVKKPDERYDLQCVEKALPGLRMPMHIADPSARVLHFSSCFFERLEQVVYSDFCTDSPEKATKQMCKHLLPGKLREVMSERIEFDKALQKEVKSFVKRIQKDAIYCQTYDPNKAPDSEKISVSLQNESQKTRTSEKKNP